MFSKSSEPLATTARVPSALLSTQNCISQTRIRSFLRLSRFATDDTIREHIDGNRAQCGDYFRTTVVPQWQARSRLIEYCQDYAHQLEVEIAAVAGAGAGAGAGASDVAFDLRRDPYAAKDHQRQIDNQSAIKTTIANWTANELQIEAIVREQTVDVLNDKCEFKDWMAEFRRASR